MKSSYNDLVVLLARGISKRVMYFKDHPQIRACCRDFTRGLTRELQASDQESFFLGVVQGKLVHEGKFLIGPTILGKKLADFAQFLECGGFLFQIGVTEEEIGSFLTLAAELNTSLDDLESARKLLEFQGITHIVLSPPYSDPGWFGQFIFNGEDSAAIENKEPLSIEQLLPIYQEMFDSVDQAHSSAFLEKSVDIGNTRRAAQNLLLSAGEDFTDVMHLVKYPDFDSYTVGHSVRVAMLAAMVGKQLGLDPNQLNEIASAALLHDVGKSRIPTEILFKPARLDAEERLIIETHPQLGAEILLESPDSTPLAIAVAWGHHLRPDEKGYPHSMVPQATSTSTKLIHVCDVFEAMTAVRPYKRALTPRQALEFMVQDKGGFDPGALQAFINAVGLYPPGSRLMLDSGWQATALSPGKVFGKPKVILTHEPDGQVIPEEDQTILDLSSDSEPSEVTCQMVEQ
jgi:putative nucleotidyltransferase with HDIG domain